MSSPLRELLFQAWDDLDHATRGLDAREASVRNEGLSSISWIVGHLGQQVDSWINVRFGGAPPHALLGDAMFHTGANGDAPPWEEILRGLREVRETARTVLNSDSEVNVARIVPYDGGIDYLRPIGLQLGYALMRTAAHHFSHTGEILTLRSLRGDAPADSWTWGLALLP